ncbi:MAG: hypothetical protein AAB789_00630, partial [Patescibacteria group bacterium]
PKLLGGLNDILGFRATVGTAMSELSQFYFAFFHAKIFKHHLERRGSAHSGGLFKGFDIQHNNYIFI